MPHIDFTKNIQKLDTINKKSSKKLWDSQGLGFNPSKQINRINIKDSVWGKGVRDGVRYVDIYARYRAMKEFIRIENQNIRMGKDKGRKRALNLNSFFDIFYFEVRQPMPIYYSRDKLYEKEMGEKVFIFNSDLDIYRFMDEVNKGKINAQDMVKFQSKYNMTFKDEAKVFLSTKDRDKYIPFDLGYKDDEVQYSNIKVKDIYIRIYKMGVTTKKSIILWTSAGVKRVDPLKPNVSAAVKFAYKHPNITTYKSVEKREFLYNQGLQRILTGKKTTIDDLRLFNNLFNPISPHYLDEDGSIIAAYKNKVRAKDRKKILQAQRIKKILMGELIKMLPDLAEGLRKYNTPDDLGKYLAKMREIALEKGSTQDQGEVFSMVLHSAYGNTIANPDNTGTKPLVLGENAGFNNNVLNPNDDYIKNDTTLQLEKAEEEKKLIAEQMQTQNPLDKIMSSIKEKKDEVTGGVLEQIPSSTDDNDMVMEDLTLDIPRADPTSSATNKKDDNLLTDKEFENLASSAGLIDGLMVDE